MKRIQALSLCAVLLAPLGAVAAPQQPMGSVGVYGTRTEGEIGGFKDDGLGFGIRGWTGFGVPFVHGEYQTATVGDGANEVDIESLRIGGGAALPVNDRFLALGKLEYVDLGSDLDEDGFGLHGGGMFMFTPALHFFGSLGYLSLSDTDGLELNAGAALHFNKQFGVFADVRRYMADVDNAPPGLDELEVTDLRVGGMLTWGL